MNERVTAVSTQERSGRRRGLFAMLAGVLFASTVAVAAPVALPTALAAPGEYTADLKIIADYPMTGVGNFDATTASPVPAFTTDAGTDANETNDVVRVGDITSYFWGVSLNDNLGRTEPPPPDDVIFEQIITPGFGADLEVTIDPSQCAGNSPSSQVLYNTPAPGQITVRCNIGFVQGTGEQVFIEVDVKAKLNSPNGSNFSTTQRVYKALNGDPSQVDPLVISGTDVSPIDPIWITAAPKWDIYKSNYGNTLNARTFNGVDDTPGYDISYDIRIQSPNPGSSALAQPFTVQDSVTFLSSIAPLVSYNGNFQIVDCFAPYYPGTCSYTPGVLSTVGGNDASLTFSGIDFSGSNWDPLNPGPFLSGFFRVTIFVPMANIDMSDGVINKSGAAYIANQINNFDPLDIAGVSNYNAGVEPGYCGPNAAVTDCALMPNITRSNNVTDNSGSAYNFDSGNYGQNGAKWYAKTVSAGGDPLSNTPGQTSIRTYDGYQQPGSYHTARVEMYNGGLTRLTDPRLCDVFDNTMVSLTQAANTGTIGLAPGTYAWGATGYNGGIDPSLWVVEYGHIDTTGDNPLANPVLNVVNNRYQGNWTQQGAATCTDGATVNGWKTDPTQVSDGATTGIDAVNAVRLRVSNPAALDQQWLRNKYITLQVPFVTRETFFGGPNDGANLPYGSVIANYGQTYTTEWGSWYHTNFPGFNPFDPILAGGNGLGDRLTIAPTYLYVKKHTIDVPTTLGPSHGGSGIDANGSATAGDPVVWEILPGAFSPFADPEPVQLLMRDVLEPYQTYDAACTAALNPGLPIPTVDYDTSTSPIGAAPGYTTLSWDLGYYTPNPEAPALPVTVFPRIKVCVLSDALASANTNLVNNVLLYSPQVPDGEFDNHVVKLGQQSRLRVKKTVDAPLDPTNDTNGQVWTLFAKNFSNLPIKTPTIIDVLPWNGDSVSTPATGSIVRIPASNFHGEYGLSGPAVVQWNDGSAVASPYTTYYSADAPNGINQDPRFNTSTWCTAAGPVFTLVSGVGPCPATFRDVTAVKVALRFNLAKKTDAIKSGVKITLNALAGDLLDPFSPEANAAGDIYTNRFVLTSPSFPQQRVISNTVNVRVVGFSLGDLVFNDANGDGNWDAGEGTAPAGVTINLYDNATGNLIDTVATDANGRYEFTDLPAGNYYVQIPAADFQNGGPLFRWDITPGAKSPNANDDGNDVVNHDGSTGPGDVTSDGITSNVITLSYHLVGTSPIGDEPTGDNTNGLLDLNNDRLTNFTLDLAIIGPPAIDVQKDVCKDGTGFNCDQNLNSDWAPLFALVASGSEAVWRITVTNTGFQVLDPVTLNDPAVGNCDNSTPGPLAPGESYVYTCSGHTVTEAPNAPFVNEITAIGTPVVGEDVSDTDDAKIAALPPSPGVGDYVWFDVDHDGIQGPNETGVDGVLVELLDGNGDVVATTTTDPSGFYSIFTTDLGDPLSAGVPYEVRFTPPPGYFQTLMDQGGDDSIDSDGLLTPQFVLGATEYNPTLDLGLVQPASLGDYVWYDLNHDGLQNDGDPSVVGVEGVEVNLNVWNGLAWVPAFLDIFGNVINPTTTDANGYYQFVNLIPGTYQVVFTLPAGTYATTSDAGSDNIDSDGLTPSTTLLAAQNDPTLDLGLIRPASLGDYVWYDTNGNGIQDGSEIGVPGVTATLTDGSGAPVVDIFGNPVNPVNTNGVGYYQFINLPPGDYTVTFSNLPGGYIPTQTGAGANIALDSDGLEVGTSLVDGQNDPTLDLGIVQPASVGDYVWFDNIHNGIQDGGEPGVVNVTVTLTDAFGDEVLDVNGDPVLPQLTDVNGHYLFINLQPGDYVVTFSNLPPGYFPTYANSGGDDSLDSDGLVVPVNLSSGEQDLTLDLGINQTPPLVSIGDFVWTDVNRNGLQDLGEPVISGFTVELYDAAGTVLLDTTTTDPQGYYFFSDLLPGTQYVVKFVPTTGQAFTTQNVNANGNDTTDSDADPATGKVSVTTPANGLDGTTQGGTDDPTIDAGIVTIDLALSKLLTAIGPFYAGSTVTFTLTPHNNGTANALAGWKVTDILPTGLTLVSMVGSAGGSSIYTCVANVCTAAGTQLAAGADAETIIVTATVDADFVGSLHNVAYISPAPTEVTETNPLITPTTTTNTATSPTNNDAEADVSVASKVSIGDYVWLDVNRNGQQDSGEPLQAGVTVNLYAANGTTFIGTTLTDPSGFYFFKDLLPGTAYVVEFIAPTGDQFTTQFAAGGVSTDSNALPATGRASVTTPSSGSNGTGHNATDEPTIDAGLVNVDLSIAKVLNTAAPIYPGATVTFTLTPKNNGTTDALTGWTVTEIMPPRLTLVSMAGTAGSSIYTCVGNVCTANTSLAAGATAETILVTATVNAGPAVTAHNVTYVSPGPGEVTESNPLVIPTTGTDTSTSTTNNDAQADVPVTALVSIGDYVWFDTNRDGLQTLGELPVGNVTVELLNAAGNSIDPDGGGPLTATTTTTNGSGFYSFTGLAVSTDYQVKFTLPSGAVFTTAGSGDEAVTNDSNPNAGTGITPVFTTPADGSNSVVSPDLPTIDAGILRMDLALAKQLTTLGAVYEGSTVIFTLTPSNTKETEALAGWSVTEILPAGLTLESMVGSAGGLSIYTCVANVCTSSAVALPGNQETIIVTAKIDANVVGALHNVAYISPAGGDIAETNPLITPDTDTNTATSPTNNDAQATVSPGSLISIGDYVWLDINRDGQQTVGEPFLANVTVNLYDENGDFVKSTTTDGAGYYFFDDLLPSTDFTVEFIAPTGDQFTSQFTGATATDSNANPADGRASVTTPASGSNGTGHGATDEPTIDAGLVNVDLTLTKHLDTAANYYPGKTIQYTLTPSNLGTTDALAGWKVTEILPSGMTFVSMVGSAGSSTYTCVSNVCTSSAVLPAGGAAGETIIVTATIDADVEGTLHNVAYISPAPTEVTETNPLATPDTSTDTSTTDTNNDAQADLTSNIYDLALAKTVAVTGTGEDTVIDYDITVQNQGTVDSGTYTVVDPIPAGLGIDVNSITDGGVFDSTAGTITWTLSGLAPGDTITVSWSAFVSDFTLRPYRNIAEIATDGGAPWGDDNDSTPDDDITNDGDYGTIGDSGIDNQTIDDAGNGGDPEDDADIADANVDLTYDLALAKSPSATTIDPAGNVVFTITVENQGDVNSEDYTITDTLPAGTAASAASDGGVIAGSTVTWNLTDLAPGATRQVTVTVHITDVTLRPFKNIAEISADGADMYDSVADIKGGDIEDIDSTPDTDSMNDNGQGIDDGYGTFENPTNDIDDIADVDAIPNGEDDADVAFFDAPVLYDLALIKTGPAAIDGNGSATFSITVLNQGNVPSGDYSVVDTIPTGLAATAASDGGVIAGQLVTWDLTGLAPGATKVVTVTVHVTDFLTRPWINVAEISSDGAADYDTDGYENADDGVVTDNDSTPDADTENDTLVDQTVLPTDQFNDPTVDEDDHDVAPIDANVVYDLALVKVLPAGQSFKKGSPINFNIIVKNQGNVDSGPITVQDVIPAGLTFVAASDGGLTVGQVVTWELASLAPGAIKTVTVTVTVSNSTLASYINLAEIVADGADAYDTPDSDVHDKDSTPDTDITNDPLVDTDDPNIDQVPGDEDDHDRALLDPSKVKKDNSALPPTGSGAEPILIGFGLLGAGALALVASRRRRRQMA